MRLTIATVSWVLMTAATFGATQADHDDCNAPDPDRKVAGCTRIIQDETESKETRAIAYVGRGLAWHIKRDLEKALADFTDAIALNSRNSLAYNNRALTWREKGDVDRAIADFDAAIGIDPLSPLRSRRGTPRERLHQSWSGLAGQR